MPDGTLLSMPIPSQNDTLSYCDLQYGKNTYSDILRQLATKHRFDQYDKCHLDPDIRNGVRINSVSGWRPAFGQIDKAQTYLSNNHLGKGDLFIFFGRFRQTRGSIDEGTLHFDKDMPIIHIIFGYMEIGGIIPYDKITGMNYTWHPHGCGERLKDKSNTLYIPAETLSFSKNYSGWGVFPFSKERVLTLSNKTGTWREIPALMPENVVGNRKNSAKGEGIYYAGQWQEIVLNENSISVEWAKSLF